MKRASVVGVVFLVGMTLVPDADAQRQNGGTAAEPEAPAKARPAGEPTGGVSLPRLIKFSAVLKDRMGQPRTGILGVTFALYQDQQGGAPLWLEVQNLELDDQGRYTVLLGATQTGGLPLELFAAGRARWLGIQVQGEEESPEASGRILLVSVPYALKAGDAETLGGKPASAFVLSDEQAKSTGTGSGTGVPPVSLLSGPGPTKEQVTGTGTTNFIAKFTAPDAVGNSLLFDNGVSIGLGTTTPNAGGSFTIAGNGLVLSGGAQDLMVPDTQDLQLGHINAAGTTFTERLRVTGGGSVGIGTTTPAVKLQVNVTNPSAGTIIGSSALSVGSVDIVTTDAQGANVGPLLALGGNRATTGTNLGVFGGIRGAKENSTDGNTAGYLGFYTLQAGVAFAERMRISSSGLVGMGTLSPNPGARLTLAGGLHMRGAVADLTVPDGENLQLGHLNFLGGLFTERMRITPTGNVGIGTTAPAEKLHVVGNLLASGSMSATSFAGSGAGLTSLNPASLSVGTAAINISGNAATATTANNALALGGVPAASFARLDIGNSFTGDQSITGNLNATGALSGSTGSFSGSTADQILNVTQRGAGVAVRGDSTAATGVTQGVVGTTSSSTDLSAGVQGEANATSGLTFGVLGVAESPSGAGVVGRASATTGSPAGVVGNVVSATGTAGLFDNEGGGEILSGQVLGVEKFSVDGSGNVTASGSVTAASFAGSGVALTGLNPASLSAGTAAIDISGTATTATTANNALALGSVPAANFARLDVGNSFTGDQSVTGNLTASGWVNGNSFRAGNLTLSATGLAGTDGTPSSITVKAGNAFSGVGSGITLTAGNGANARGGQVNVAAGITSSWSGAGASSDVFIRGGEMEVNASYAQIQVGGGKAIQGGVNESHGGVLQLLGGNGVGTNRNGGHIVLLPGAASGSGMPGNVGIGTTTPSEKLHIVSGNTEILAGGPGAQADLHGIDLRSSQPGHAPTLWLTHTGSGGRQYRIASWGDNVNPGSLRIRDDTAGAERVTIDAGGNVGIGTTTPGEKLSVAGIVQSTSGGFKFPDGTTQTTAGGGGDITAVTAGTGLSGGGTSGDVTLSLASAACPAAQALITLPASCAAFATLAANSFTGDQSITGRLTITDNLNTEAVVQVTQNGTGAGVYSRSEGSTGFGVYGIAPQGIGLVGRGGDQGVSGRAEFSTGVGVQGEAGAASGATYGVSGWALSTGGTGVFGSANATTGATIGVKGYVRSAGGTAGVFHNFASGKILSGQAGIAETEVFSVDGSGNVRANAYLDLGGNPIGTGDITAVTAGTGLSGGGTTGDVTLSLDTSYTDGRYSLLGHGHDVAQITNAATLGANSFSGNQSITGNLTASGTVESTSGGFKFPDGSTQTTAARGELVMVLVDDFDYPTLGPTIWDTYTTGVASVSVSSSQAGLQTDGPNEARLTSDKQFPLSAGTLIFKAKISAYSEASTVYGDKQPRGLVAGSDRNNAVEFISSNGATLGCRTVSGGTVTETLVSIGQFVSEWAFYQIVATPTVVKFYFNGALIATHTTNIPTVPLNVYIGTSYTGGGNIPVSVEWVSFERRL